jgi:nucleoid-associated protein YgaU
MADTALNEIPSASSPGPSSDASLPVRTNSKDGNAAWLAEKTNGANRIDFDFNPAQITISHTVIEEKDPANEEKKESGPSGQPAVFVSPEAQLAAAGTTTVTLNNIIFDGFGVQGTCSQLLNWSYPEPNTVGQAKPDKVGRPVLKFKWGTLVFEGKLQQATVTYKKFSSKGIPTRASVNLTLSQSNLPHQKTNPTSGGLPGRRTHVLTSGQSLPGIATAGYGEPGVWRALAVANRVDDPLRVRPGTLLYLPSRAELARPGTVRP